MLRAAVKVVVGLGVGLCLACLAAVEAGPPWTPLGPSHPASGQVSWIWSHEAPPLDQRILAPAAYGVRGRCAHPMDPERGALPLLEQETKRVSLRADAPAQRTGLEVEAGDVVRVPQLAGGWTVDKRLSPRVDVRGHLELGDLYEKWGAYRDEQALPFGRLLVGLAGTGRWADGGSGADLMFSARGELTFKINDQECAYGDNAGAVLLRVEVLRPIPICREIVRGMLVEMGLH
jgi:hypothetical protein